jgi:hypothetical protein
MMGWLTLSREISFPVAKAGKVQYIGFQSIRRNIFGPQE